MRRKSNRNGWLTAEWSKRENDVLYHYPNYPDGHYLHNAFMNPLFPDELPFIKELERRGYDLTTLQFSIKMKTV